MQGLQKWTYLISILMFIDCMYLFFRCFRNIYELIETDAFSVLNEANFGISKTKTNVPLCILYKTGISYLFFPYIAILILQGHHFCLK